MTIIRTDSFVSSKTGRRAPQGNSKVVTTEDAVETIRRTHAKFHSSLVVRTPTCIIVETPGLDGHQMKLTGSTKDIGAVYKRMPRLPKQAED